MGPFKNGTWGCYLGPNVPENSYLPERTSLMFLPGIFRGSHTLHVMIWLPCHPWLGRRLRLVRYQHPPQCLAPSRWSSAFIFWLDSRKSQYCCLFSLDFTELQGREWRGLLSPENHSFFKNNLERNVLFLINRFIPILGKKKYMLVKPVESLEGGYVKVSDFSLFKNSHLFLWHILCACWRALSFTGSDGWLAGKIVISLVRSQCRVLRLENLVFQLDCCYVSRELIIESSDSVGLIWYSLLYDTVLLKTLFGTMERVGCLD